MATRQDGTSGRAGASRPLTLLGAGVALVAMVLAAPAVGEQAVELRARMTAECTVDTGTSLVRLTAEQAQRATTAVAVAEQGTSAQTDDIDPAVLQRLADGPAGDAGPVLTCRAEPDSDLTVEAVGDDGLTPRARAVLDAMTDVFGAQSLGGFAPGGVDSGHGAESTHYDGRAVDVFFRPVTEDSRRRGWVLAHWLVAHAQDLDIQYVIWDDRYWGVRGSGRGWRDYDAPPPRSEILRHLDHVHVDVLRGS
jgi:hypothetical protein